ncbi:hypothetical protein RIVM261_025460 [Rivularia sp. IAM M-261]|nr:hypothetical protein RIVM261_025460 [Rivularia sp. IAM M-261]
MRFKYKLLALAALSIALTQTVTPATALPGQSVKSFLKWAKNRPLPTLQQNSAYGAVNNQHQNYVNTAPKSKKINKTNVTDKKDTIKFSQYNEKALKLILKVYSNSR